MERESDMARRAFYSFHYNLDNWRASLVRSIGVVDGNKPVSDNDWEAVKKGGEVAIKRWIDNQLRGRGVTIVLIGSNTAGRRWINYEIETSWDDGKGVVGVYVHNLKNSLGRQSSKGQNPFGGFTMERDNAKLSSIVKAYDPPFTTSTYAYEYISDNLDSWVEEAIRIRNDY